MDNASTTRPERLATCSWVQFLSDTRRAGRAQAEPYDVIIVGSGYGGGMAAHALAAAAESARRPLRVLMLERGKAFHAGDFPSTFGELPRELRLTQQATGEVQGHEGLFDLRLGPDMATLVANGVGGGSLINAGVMLEPAPWDVSDDLLARRICEAKVSRRYARARRLLGAEVKRGAQWVCNSADRLKGVEAPGPGGRPQPVVVRKLEALRQQAATRNLQVDAVPISIAMDHGPNLAGAAMTACNGCGDCMTGCNVGAKESIDRNLLLSAQGRMFVDLQVVTGASVLSLRRSHAGRGSPEHWLLEVAHTDRRLQQREEGTFRIPATRVVLAAGTLGSTEILLRSRSDRLQFSPRLGESFSGNGDDIAALHRLPFDVHGAADEDVPVGQRGVGPTVTGKVSLRGKDRPFLLEEFAVPGPVRRFFDEVVTTGHTIAAMTRPTAREHHEDDLDPVAVDPQAMNRTLLVGVIGHDDASGTLRLSTPTWPHGDVPQQGAVCIHWPDARWSREMDAAHDAARGFAERKGQAEPVLVANPMWRLLPPGLERLVSQPRGPVLTVHPLGGCRMGADVDQGVVDGLGRVFDATPVAARGGDDWHGSLLVLDGSIVGASLGVNPSLTIAALALQAMEELLVDGDEVWGPLGRAAPGPESEPGSSCTTVPAPDCASWGAPAVPAGPPPERTKVEIVERMVTESITLPGDRTVVAELTMAFRPTALSDLTAPQRKPIELVPERSRLRLYDAHDWAAKHYKHRDDDERVHGVIFESELQGSLRLLHRGQTQAPQRRRQAAWAWLLNRGTREIWVRFFEPCFSREAADRRAAQRASRPKPSQAGSRWQRVKQEWREFCASADHAGQIRWFDYDLKLGPVLKSEPGLSQLLVPGSAVKAHKRLRYERFSSPWTQLTRMRLTRFPGLPVLSRDHMDQGPLAELDPRYLARQGIPLLHVTAQRHHAEALAELLTLGLYLMRVVIDVHLWSFRKPDPAPLREPDRLPRALPRIPDPQITTLAVDRWPRDTPQVDQPVTIRLTRYPQEGHRTGGKPLVMIHGYSASGTTFAHPAVRLSAAGYFWAQGRDVWVLDLRTSCGLPSAAHPWAMEQPALIDIPAALLHVRQVTGQKVDVLAHCIGAAMLSMALLGRGERVRSGRQALGVDTWLSRAQLGTLDAFNRRDADGSHHTVDHVVMSQKGPVMRYTDANVLRAYVLQYVRRFVLPKDYRFQRGREPRVMEELTDRLLASLPYNLSGDPSFERREFQRENPMWPCAKTGWTATRHRVDALFGRTFTAHRMGKAALDAVDDFFGPLNLDTVAQTIHFAEWDVVTNQRGRGEFVTSQDLCERWAGIATLAVHGNENGLSDPYTLVLARQTFSAAGLPLAELSTYTGHQDTFIGNAASPVFEAIEEFLQAPAPQLPKPPGGDPLQVRCCWIGPRLAMPDAAHRARVAVRLRPDQGSARLWMVPVRRGAARLVPVAARTVPWVAGDFGPSRRWLFAQPTAADVDVDRDALRDGWVCVAVYPSGQTTTGTPAALPASDGLARAVDLWWHRQRPAQLLDAFVSAADLRRCQELPRAEWLRFALGSCQYPSGLFDRTLAGDSLEQLANGADDVSLTLMVGDQIYADATAGLLDPTRRDERYEVPHQRALRVRELRRVMQRMPVQMLLDDHELADNWQPLPPTLLHDEHNLGRKQLKTSIHRAREQGTRAFRDFQRMMSKSEINDAEEGDHTVDLAFEAGGHAFYLLDTRTRRLRSQPADPAPWGWIVDAQQRADFERWLDANRERVKFVATPSLLLPRRQVVATGEAQACRSDAWDGFIDSMRWLLALIDRGRHQDLVFLSGDEHHSILAEAFVGANRTKVVSVHASALYAPYPFANGRPKDLVARERQCTAYGTPFDCDATFVPAGDGYAVLDVLQRREVPHLRVEFGKGGPSGATSYLVPLR